MRWFIKEKDRKLEEGLIKTLCGKYLSYSCKIPVFEKLLKKIDKVLDQDLK
jgi:hypothetical protein